MEYIELNIHTHSAEQSEILTALLADMPFESFVEEEALLKAYIPSSDYALCRQEVEQLLAEELVSEFSIVKVEQQNWNAEWEGMFEPVRVEGERPILIRAQHHAAAEAGVMDVVIAPRMSFGTGHHATTALMSKAIVGIPLEGRRGLDVGCGTGVLAIVAMKGGAREMVAVDIDDWACDSCRESMALSGVELDVRCGSMETVEGECFDFVLANINRNILVAMMPQFASSLPSGGDLLMSGFLSEDVAHIAEAAAAHGFDMVGHEERDGWVVVKCKKL